VLEGINRVLREALTTESEEELGRTCLAVAEEVTQSKFGFVGEIGPSGRIDAIAISDPGWEACKGGDRRPAPACPRDSRSTGFTAVLILSGQGFFTNDPPATRTASGRRRVIRLSRRFWACPETRREDHRMIGVGNREGGYSAQDLESLEALALAVVQVFMRKRAERAVRAGEERLRQAQKLESIGLLPAA